MSVTFGVFYVLGLVCVNLYGSRFGLRPFSLVQLQYSFAGAWVAGFLVLSSFPFVVGMFTYGPGRRLRILLCLAPFVAWYLVAKWFGEQPADAVMAGLIFGLIVVLLSIFAVPLIHALIPSLNEQVGWILRGIRLYVCGCAFLCLLGIYVWCFASFAYEHIPNWIGGGQPQRARIKLKHDAAIRRRADGDLQMPSESDTSLPLDLLLQTEKVRYVRQGPEPSDVHQISNEEIVDVQIKPPNSGQNWELWEVVTAEEQLISQLDSIEQTERQQLVHDLFRDVTNNVFRVARVDLIISPEKWPHITISRRYKESLPFDWQCDSTCSGLVWEFQWIRDRASKQAGGQPKNTGTLP